MVSGDQSDLIGHGERMFADKDLLSPKNTLNTFKEHLFLSATHFNFVIITHDDDAALTTLVFLHMEKVYEE